MFRLRKLTPARSRKSCGAGAATASRSEFSPYLSRVRAGWSRV